MVKFNIHPSWRPLFDQYIFSLDSLYKETKVYPSQQDVFNVFKIDVKDIRIVLLGQDPYHNEGQAHGLSFSVQKDIKSPPSLRNIFKELTLEFPERKYTFPHGCLERWLEEEKIFLLNSSLTVQKNQAGSHMDLWEEFTDEVIEYIYQQNKSCVFLLMGNFAKSKAVFVKDKSRIVSCPHPSPLARGFIGSNVFKQVETALKTKINWNV